MTVRDCNQFDVLIQRLSVLSRVHVADLDKPGIQGLQSALYDLATDLAELKGSIQQG